MWYFIISSSIFLLAPFFWNFFKSKKKFFGPLRFIVYSLVGFFVLFHILPEIIFHSSEKILSIFLFIFGFFLFTFFETFFSLKGNVVYKTAILVSTIGLVAHTIIDGIGLGGHSSDHLPELLDFSHHHTKEESTTLLKLSIILHRIPFSFFIWDNFNKIFNKKISYLLMIVLCLSTFAGVLVGESDSLVRVLGENLNYLQAFIAGAIFHVLLEPFLHKH